MSLLRRRRLPLVVTALLGVGLLAFSVLSTVQAGRSAQADTLDHSLTTEALSIAGGLSEYFERARTVDLLLAHESVFLQFQPDRRRDGGQVRSVSSAAGSALAYLEKLYPGQISEACLIDDTGQELVRVVEGTIAPDSELSAEEADNPFFAPTLALPAGSVHQAAPYLSPDTHQWVISNSTPLVGADGRPWGLVHFEVSLASFLPAAGPSTSDRGFQVSILDARTARELFRRGEQLSPDALGREGSPQLAKLLQGGGEVVTGDLDGRRAGIARVASDQDNGNSWAVLVTAPAGAADLAQTVGPAPIATALAAAFLLLFAGLNLRHTTRELRAAGLSDELTGLPNRRLLTDRLAQALLLVRRRNSACAVLLLDLDRFKEVNDTLGHQYGDRLLRAVATRLTAELRASDTVARLGGDEFAVLLPEVTSPHSALDVARKLVTALCEPFAIDDVMLSIEASIGIAVAPRDGDDPGALLRAADVAMYVAKERRAGAVLYDAEHDVNTPTRLALLGDLRRALQTGELFLHYQPKVALGTGEVRGVEALVRWRHPTRGLVPPVDFIPVVEGTGLMHRLTLHTLELAIVQARRWHDEDTPLQVAVNLSPRVLMEPGFAAEVQELLAAHCLSPGLLRLEITESVVMSDPARALDVLTTLQHAGVSLSIDDFGTGYSSMSYLKRLPVDELKIDRSFVSDMLADTNDGTLVRSCIDLGHNLGMSVVAEGVEDDGTRAELTALGCDVAQGYHFARPMPPEAVPDWLQQNAGTPFAAAYASTWAGSSSARTPRNGADTPTSEDEWPVTPNQHG